MSEVEKFEKLIQVCRKLKMKIKGGLTLTIDEVNEFCKAWEEYYNSLPDYAKDWAFATFSFGVIKFSEVSKIVKENPKILELLVNIILGEEP